MCFWLLWLASACRCLRITLNTVVNDNAHVLVLNCIKYLWLVIRSLSCTVTASCSHNRTSVSSSSLAGAHLFGTCSATINSESWTRQKMKSTQSRMWSCLDFRMRCEENNGKRREEKIRNKSFAWNTDEKSQRSRVAGKMVNAFNLEAYITLRYTHSARK